MEKELPRLQKALAAAGVASRRACETLIAEGQVQVNGKVVRELGTKVDPTKDEIRVNGERVAMQQKHKPLYIMLNKPGGFTSTASDPHADHTVLELLAQIEERVYPVGRLDVDSEGLLLLTNDGEFANRLTHPRYHVPKLYRVRARGFVGRVEATRLAEGIDLEDGRTAAAEVRFIEYDSASLSTIVEITLYEGRNRQVRRMFEAIGHPVRQLTRIGFGSLRLAGLNSGTWRKLRPEEVDALLALALPTPTPPKSERRIKSSGPYRPPYPRAVQDAEGETRRPGHQETVEGEEAQDTRHKIQDTRYKAQDTWEEGEGKRKEDLTQNPKSKIQNPAPRPFENRKPQGQRSDRRSAPTFGQKPGQKPAPRPTSKYGPKTGGPRSPRGYEEDDSRPRAFDPSEMTRQLDHPARPATPFEKKIARMAKPNVPSFNSGSNSVTRPDERRPAPGGSPVNARPAPRPAFGARSDQYPKPRPQNPNGPRNFAPRSAPAPTPDGTTNNAQGRKAGIPYVPRPKPGFAKFGRAKP
jgi:23S rRNA pseudouridine2605 synthase